jgi:hypothetical protein
LLNAADKVPDYDNGISLFELLNPTSGQQLASFIDLQSRKKQKNKKNDT